MNLLESFEKEIETNTKVLCLTPYDRDFPFIFLSIQEYLECENLSDLWNTGFVEEFEYSYQGENTLIHQLDEYKFKTIIHSIEDDTDFDELTAKILKLHYGYLETVEISFYEYNYAVHDENGNNIFYFNETALVEELLEEELGISINDLQAKYHCIDIYVNTECYFNQGNWHDIDYIDSKKLKIQFID